MTLQFITLNDFFNQYEKDRYVLGKKFANTIKKQIDQKYVNWCRMKVEELKLQIIDAAESGRHPPVLQDVDWLYKISYRRQQYKFIAKEFYSWLDQNGLTYSFDGYDSNYCLKIYLSSYVDFETVADARTIRLDDILKKPQPKTDIEEDDKPEA